MEGMFLSLKVHAFDRSQLEGWYVGDLPPVLGFSPYCKYLGGKRNLIGSTQITHTC